MMMMTTLPITRSTVNELRAVSAWIFSWNIIFLANRATSKPRQTDRHTHTHTTANEYLLRYSDRHGKSPNEFKSRSPGLWHGVMLWSDTNVSPWRWRKHGPLKRVLPQYYKGAQSRRRWLESSPLWKPQISHQVQRKTDKSEYQAVSKSFRTGRMERELQVLQLSATRCSCIAIFWVSLVSFAAITFCVASPRVFIFVVVVVYFVIASVRKLLDISTYSSIYNPHCDNILDGSWLNTEG
jgi:hypothetical protein